MPRSRQGASIPFVFKTEAPSSVTQPARVLNAIRKRQRLYRAPREIVERAILDRQNVEMASLPTPDKLQVLVASCVKGSEIGRNGRTRKKKAAEGGKAKRFSKSAPKGKVR